MHFAKMIAKKDPKSHSHLKTHTPVYTHLSTYTKSHKHTHKHTHLLCWCRPAPWTHSSAYRGRLSSDVEPHHPDIYKVIQISTR